MWKKYKGSLLLAPKLQEQPTHSKSRCAAYSPQKNKCSLRIPKVHVQPINSTSISVAYSHQKVEMQPTHSKSTNVAYSRHNPEVHYQNKGNKKTDGGYFIGRTYLHLPRYVLPPAGKTLLNNNHLHSSKWARFAKEKTSRGPIKYYSLIIPYRWWGFNSWHHNFTQDCCCNRLYFRDHVQC